MNIRKLFGLGGRPEYEAAMEAYNQGRYEEALAGLAKTAEAAPPKSVQGALARFYQALCQRNLGLLALHQGHHAEAAERLKEALRFSREDARLAYLRAVALSRQGEHLAALEEMERAAASLSGQRLPGALVILNLNAGRIKCALEILDRLITAHPAYPDLHYHKGVALARLNRLAEAQVEVETALRFNPNYAQARTGLGLILGLSGRTTEALEILDSSLADPATWRARLEEPLPVARGLGELLTRLDKSDQGLLKTLANIFESDLDYHPDWPDLHYNLALVYRHLERLDLAVAALRRALEINPAYGQARQALAACLAELDLTEDAVD